MSVQMVTQWLAIVVMTMAIVTIILGMVWSDLVQIDALNSWFSFRIVLLSLGAWLYTVSIGGWHPNSMLYGTGIAATIYIVFTYIMPIL